jgi:hypothetical protein
MINTIKSIADGLVGYKEKCTKCYERLHHVRRDGEILFYSCGQTNHPQVNALIRYITASQDLEALTQDLIEIHALKKEVATVSPSEKTRAIDALVERSLAHHEIYKICDRLAPSGLTVVSFNNGPYQFTDRANLTQARETTNRLKRETDKLKVKKKTPIIV